MIISEMQHKLATWAKEDPSKRFGRLLRLIARTFKRIDHVVFWKLGHWLGRKYKSRIKPLMREWYCMPTTGKAKTWIVFGVSERGKRGKVALYRLVGSPKGQFRWRNPEINPYIKKIEPRSTITSRYHDVAMAMGQA